MPTATTRIAENLRRVQQRVQSACGRSGREPSSVRLVAVVKYARMDWVRSLLELGVCDLGESRPQQLLERAPQLGTAVNWHLVGHLQRNKARRILPLVGLIHSVDTFRLLATLDRLAEELDLSPKVLLQVNVAGEAQKHGFSPNELIDGWRRVIDCRRVRVDGLMAMAPLVDEAEETRPVFQNLRELRDRLRGLDPQLPLPELSMGMSRDFEIAVEEGATLVRIGSGLFEGL